MGFTRARQPEQIEARSREILDVALRLLNEKGYQDVSLNEIAREVGMAKSNIYRYFESKECIFQTLMLEHIGDVTTKIEEGLYAIEGSDDPEKVASLMAVQFSKCPVYNELDSMFKLIIERNLSEKMLTRFVDRYQTSVLHITKAMLVAMPSMDIFQVETFLKYIVPLKKAMWAEADESSNETQIFMSHNIREFRIDFEKDLKMGILFMLKGILAESKG